MGDRVVGDLERRFPTLEAILRRSLVIPEIEDQVPYGHPQVNDENASQRQLAKVLKLMLAKVSRYRGCNHDEVEELAARVDIITIPQLATLYSKDKKIPEDHFYVLLSGKCLAVQNGIQSLMDQSITRLFSTLQKKHVPGYRIIRPLVDPLLPRFEDGVPIEDIIVMSEETAIFGRLSSDLQYHTVLRALALKKKKVRSTMVKNPKGGGKDNVDSHLDDLLAAQFGEDAVDATMEGEEIEASAIKMQESETSPGKKSPWKQQKKVTPRDDDEFEYMLQNMAATISQPLSTFLSERPKTVATKDYDPDCEIIGFGQEEEEEVFDSTDTKRTETKQLPSRIRNIIKYYKRLRHKCEISGLEVSRSLINNARKCMITSVVETARDGDKDFTMREVEHLYPEKKDDDRFAAELLDLANHGIVPREDEYLETVTACTLKLKEFWHRYLAQTNPAAASALALSQSAPDLKNKPVNEFIIAPQSSSSQFKTDSIFKSKPKKDKGKLPPAAEGSECKGGKLWAAAKRKTLTIAGFTSRQTSPRLEQGMAGMPGKSVGMKRYGSRQSTRLNGATRGFLASSGTGSDVLSGGRGSLSRSTLGGPPSSGTSRSSLTKEGELGQGDGSRASFGVVASTGKAKKGLYQKVSHASKSFFDAPKSPSNALPGRSTNVTYNLDGTEKLEEKAITFAFRPGDDVEEETGLYGTTAPPAAPATTQSQFSTIAHPIYINPHIAKRFPELAKVNANRMQQARRTQQQATTTQGAFLGVQSPKAGQQSPKGKAANHHTRLPDRLSRTMGAGGFGGGFEQGQFEVCRKVSDMGANAIATASNGQPVSNPAPLKLPKMKTASPKKPVHKEEEEEDVVLASREEIVELYTMLGRAEQNVKSILAPRNFRAKMHNSDTDKFRGRNGQISVEKFMSTAHEEFARMDDTRKSILNGMFTIKFADPGTVLLYQGQPWDHIIALVGGKVEVLVKFDQKFADQRPFNHYIKEQALVVFNNQANVYEGFECGSGTWFGHVVDVDNKDGKPGDNKDDNVGGHKDEMASPKSDNRPLNGKKKRPDSSRGATSGDEMSANDGAPRGKTNRMGMKVQICPITVRTKTECVYLQCNREAFAAFMRSEGADRIFHMDLLTWIPSTNVIEKNHYSDQQWNRFKNASFKELLAPNIDHHAKSYYSNSKSIKWFQGDALANAYEARSQLKFRRARSAGHVRNLKTYHTQSMIPYTSRFLNNRVPPGGGPLMRTAWSGHYMEYLWSTGFDFQHRHKSDIATRRESEEGTATDAGHTTGGHTTGGLGHSHGGAGGGAGAPSTKEFNRGIQFRRASHQEDAARRTFSGFGNKAKDTGGKPVVTVANFHKMESSIKEDVLQRKKKNAKRFESTYPVLDMYVPADDNPCHPAHIVTRKMGFNS